MSVSAATAGSVVGSGCSFCPGDGSGEASGTTAAAQPKAVDRLLEI